MKRVLKYALCSALINIPDANQLSMDQFRSIADELRDHIPSKISGAFPDNALIVIYGFPEANVQEYLVFHAVNKRLPIVYVEKTDDRLYEIYVGEMMRERYARFIVPVAASKPLLCSWVANQ